MLYDLPENYGKVQISDDRFRSFAAYAPDGRLVAAEVEEHGWYLLPYEIREYDPSTRRDWDLGKIRGYGCYVINEREDSILAEERDTILVEAVAKALLAAQTKPLRAEDV